MKQKYTYTPHGTCSRNIEFSIEDGRIHDLQFTGGCMGNLSGLSSLIEGMDAREVSRRLHGIQCGVKGTSCPDQLSRAIDKALTSQK